eukprot:TRINITY_DN2859_c0_g1_i1.p2 TRINITY_DN2859_c0_g1~~TRINITY_DN2859_c0_g1_i1.p2  ORF type:complete len:105 (-),score=45.54 TRINITY_DN2859_c0_g1_i1:10-285(-)
MCIRDRRRVHGRLQKLMKHPTRPSTQTAFHNRRKSAKVESIKPKEIELPKICPYRMMKTEERQWLEKHGNCLLYTSPSPRDLSTSRMPSSA